MSKSTITISEPQWARNDPRRPKVREIGKDGEHVGSVIDGVFRSGDLELTLADLRKLIAEMERLSK